MSASGPIVVFGGTGRLGAAIVGLLSETSTPLRVVVRGETDAGTRRHLEALGASAISADLTDPASLQQACHGASTIVSAATAIRSREERDTVERVDRDGHLALMEIAEAEGVDKFVYLSFPVLTVDCALQHAKRAVEARLMKSRMRHTILRAANFSEVWLGPACGFDPVRGHVRIFGEGDGATNWISVHDVARFAVAAAETDVLDNKLLEVGGLDSLSQQQVLGIYEAFGVSEFVREHVSEAALRERLSRASSSADEARAAIALSTSVGVRVDPVPALDLLPGRMVSVRDYVQQTIARSSESKNGGSHG
jgi:uncharacterized protein YbjT (DUF2867 family)